jgi:biopolymer transport protein ExbD
MAAIEQSSRNRNSNNKSVSVRRTRTSTRIDMTPMVDLAFLLLTFFVMTTSLNKQFIMGMQMPDKESEGTTPTAIPEKRALTLILAEGNKIYWYQGLTNPKIETTNFSSDGIRKVLLDKKQQINNLYVLIKATDQSKYQNIVDILDEIAITEVKDYAIIDLTTTDKELIASR